MSTAKMEKNYMKTQTRSNISYSRVNIFQGILDRVTAKDLGSTVLVPHVCDNVNVFGSNFANAIDDYYPKVRANFNMLHSVAKLGHVQYVSVFKDPKYHYEIIFANMVAQNGTFSNKNPRPFNYIALAHCLSNVNSYVKKYLSEDSSRKLEIHIPQFGISLAGSNWALVKHMIDDSLSMYSSTIY